MNACPSRDYSSKHGLLLEGYKMVEVNTKKNVNESRKSFRISKNIAMALDYVKSKADINERADVDAFVKTEILNKYIALVPSDKSTIEQLLKGGQ